MSILRGIQDTFIEKNPDILLLHTPHRCKLLHGKEPTPNQLYLQEECIERGHFSRAHCIFHQVEGLYIDKDVSFADSNKPALSQKKCLVKKRKFVYAPLISPLLNLALRLMCLVIFAVKGQCL